MNHFYLLHMMTWLLTSRPAVGFHSLVLPSQDAYVVVYRRWWSLRQQRWRRPRPRQPPPPRFQLWKRKWRQFVTFICYLYLCERSMPGRDFRQEAHTFRLTESRSEIKNEPLTNKNHQFDQWQVLKILKE